MNKLVVIECPRCGAVFALEEQHYDETDELVCPSCKRFFEPAVDDEEEEAVDKDQDGEDEENDDLDE